MRKPVEARRDQRVNRRRNRVRRTALREHRRHLLEIERVAFGGFGDARAGVPVERPFLSDLVEQLVRLLLRQRLEYQPAAHLRQPSRTLVEEIRTRQANQQEGRVVGPAGEILEQVEQRRLGPVDVFDDDDERLIAGELFEQTPYRPERLAGGCLRRGRADGAEDPSRDELRVLAARQDLAHTVVAAQRPDDGHQRPERDPVAVREAASRQCDRLVLQRGAQLGCQARLPDPGRPDQREQPARPGRNRRGIPVPQGFQLQLAADERRVEPSCVCTGALDHREDVPRREWIGLALQRQLVARLEHDRVLDESSRRLADEDLACARRLLEALRDVDRVARDEHLSTCAVARDYLAAVDADADADAYLQFALELLIQLGQRLTQLGRGAHRPQRVVLVQLGDAEDGHDGIADELLDRAAVPLEHERHLLEEAGHHAAQRLRVEPLTERRRIRDVREQDGDRAPTDGHVLSVGLELESA